LLADKWKRSKPALKDLPLAKSKREILLDLLNNRGLEVVQLRTGKIWCSRGKLIAEDEAGLLQTTMAKVNKLQPAAMEEQLGGEWRTAAALQDALPKLTLYVRWTTQGFLGTKRQWGDSVSWNWNADGCEQNG
jgi:hypothetical protein